MCSSLSFLFLIEQMERQSLADLGKGKHYWRGMLAALLFQWRTKTFQGVHQLGKHFRRWMLADLGMSRTLISIFSHSSHLGSAGPTWLVCWWAVNFAFFTRLNYFIIGPVCSAYPDIEVLSHGTSLPWKVFEYLGKNKEHASHRVRKYKKENSTWHRYGQHPLRWHSWPNRYGS